MFYHTSRALLRIVKLFGLIKDFAVIDIYPLPKRLHWYKDNNEWFIGCGFTLVIITPKGWRSPYDLETSHPPDKVA